jgi:hypothetical protein
MGVQLAAYLAVLGTLVLASRLIANPPARAAVLRT